MMSLTRMLTTYKMTCPLARLPIYNTTGLRSITSGGGPLYIHLTNTLLGEPMKKKKKIDPNVLRKRDERRKKKLQKQIRRLEKISVANLKPIEEHQIPLKLMDEAQIRTRAKPVLSERESEERILLEKSWSTYKHEVMKNEMKAIERMLFSQKQALQELKAISSELYSSALTIDEGLLPYKTRGPSDTPPKKNYYCPDGRYIHKRIIYPGEKE